MEKGDIIELRLVMQKATMHYIGSKVLILEEANIRSMPSYAPSDVYRIDLDDAYIRKEVDFSRYTELRLFWIDLESFCFVEGLKRNVTPSFHRGGVNRFGRRYQKPLTKEQELLLEEKIRHYDP